MSKRLSYLIVVAAFLLTYGCAQADWIEVKQSATLKAEPDGDASIVARLKPGAQLDLLAPAQENGYYQVRTKDGQKGWVYRTKVERHPGVPQTLPPVESSDSSGKLEVHIFDVGQGDALVIRCPDGDHEMLIDAADTRYPNSKQNFRKRLGELQADDNAIEVVVVSHGDNDHMGSMDWVLNTYHVNLYVDNGLDPGTQTYKRVKAALTANGARYCDAQEDPAPEIDFCPRDNVDARMLRPAGFGDEHEPNDNSIVVRVDYGETSFLFVGDCMAHEEALLLEDANTKPLLDCDFLKVGHHGAATSSGPEFLAAVTPRIAAISCGAKDVYPTSKYKHPQCQAVEAILEFVGPREGPTKELEAFEKNGHPWKRIELNKALYVTTVDGEIVFESDGHEIHRRL